MADYILPISGSALLSLAESKSVPGGNSNDLAKHWIISVPQLLQTGKVHSELYDNWESARASPIPGKTVIAHRIAQ